MIHCVAALLLLPFAGGLRGATPAAQKAAAAPQTVLHNDALRMLVYLPDKAKGFYTGIRFDWSGVIGELEVGGHHLYQPWFTAVDPAVRDFIYTANGVTAGANSAATGPVEEFKTAFGYDTAKVGETYLKLGVGILRKLEDRPASYDTRAELVDGGTWTTKSTATTITFTQTLGKPGDRYAYVYTKTLRLGTGATFTMEHDLRNVGTADLSTPLYNHNFLTVNGGQVPAETSITVPYTLHPHTLPELTEVVFAQHTATYRTALQGEDKVTFDLHGFGASAADYDFTVHEPVSGVTVRARCDQPLVDASVWSIAPVLAVEPFIHIDATPGSDVRWTYTYSYSTSVARTPAY